MIDESAIKSLMASYAKSAKHRLGLGKISTRRRKDGVWVRYVSGKPVMWFGDECAKAMKKAGLL